MPRSISSSTSRMAEMMMRALILSSLLLIPPVVASSAEGSDGTVTRSETANLFEAISECSNLNPDPVEGDEEDDDDDRIIFEADREAVEGFTGVFLGSGDGVCPRLSREAADGSQPRMFTSTLTRTVTGSARMVSR